MIDLTVPLIILGYVNWGAVELSRADYNESDRIFWSIFLIKLMNAVIVVLFLITFLKLNSDFSNYYQPIILLLFAPILLAFDSTYFLVARQKVWVYSSISIFVKLSSVFLIFAFVNKESDALMYAALTLAANSCISIFTFIYVFINYVRPIKLSDRIPFRRIIKSSFSFSVLLVLSFFLDKYDILLVQTILGEYSVGLYSAAQKLSISIYGIIAVIYTVFHSESLGANSAQNSNSLNRNTTLSIYAMLWVLIPIVVGSLFVSKELIATIISPDYTDSHMVFILLNLTLLPQSAIIVLGSSFLIIKGHIKKINLIYFVMFIIGLASSSLLSFGYGMQGIAGGLFLAKIVGLVAIILLVRQYQLSFHKKAIFAPVFGSSIMGIFLMSIEGHLNIFLSISISSVIYLFAISMLYYRDLYQLYITRQQR